MNESFWRFLKHLQGSFPERSVSSSQFLLHFQFVMGLLRPLEVRLEFEVLELVKPNLPPKKDPLKYQVP